VDTNTVSPSSTVKRFLNSVWEGSGCWLGSFQYRHRVWMCT